MGRTAERADDMTRRYSISRVQRAGDGFFARRDGVPLGVRRVAGYLRGVFSGGMASWDIRFDQVARGLGVSRRTVERALAWLRQHDREFKFLTRRVGRAWAVRVSLRQKKPPLSRTLSPRCRSKGTNQNATGRLSGQAGKLTTAGERKLARFAGFIARRDLAALHYDNCKVHFRFAHAFNFALGALRRGFARRVLVQAYEAALIRRHKDATDLGLSRGGPVKFEPSSTVSLAASLLKDGRTDSERVRQRLKLLEPAKAAAAELAERCRTEFAALMAKGVAA